MHAHDYGIHCCESQEELWSEQSVISGWSAELVAAHVKERVLAKILDQEAQFFDQPGFSTATSRFKICAGTSNAAVVTAINQQSANLMAVSRMFDRRSNLIQGLDYRMVLIVYNNASIIFCLILAFVYNWELALIGRAIRLHV